MDLALAVPIGVVVGAVLGLLGAGGSLLTVPALVFLLGLSTIQATGTSLVAVAMMAVAGVLVHRHAGRCSCREGFAFGGAAAVTAAASGWAAAAIPDRVLAAAFVVLLVGTAVWLLRRGAPAGGATGGDPGGRRVPGGMAATGLAGGGIGALTGLLGVGGGFLIVPALLVTRDMRMSMAVGTSQLVVLISALAGLAGRATGGTVQWSLGLLFGLGGVVGAAVGARLADRAPDAALRKGFAAVALVVAAAMASQVVAGSG